MKRDIDEHGYCLVKEALTPEQLAEARERLSEQAEAERTGERKGLTFAYQPPMFRPFENYPMELLPEVYEEVSQELLDLLGFMELTQQESAERVGATDRQVISKIVRF